VCVRENECACVCVLMYGVCVGSVRMCLYGLCTQVVVYVSVCVCVCYVRVLCGFCRRQYVVSLCVAVCGFVAADVFSLCALCLGYVGVGIVSLCVLCVHSVGGFVSPLCVCCAVVWAPNVIAFPDPITCEQMGSMFLLNFARNSLSRHITPKLPP